MSSEEIGNSGRLPAPPTGENTFESNSAETPPLEENGLFEAPVPESLVPESLAAEPSAFNESALGNLSTAVAAPAASATGKKREQTVAQRKVMANQNVQRKLLVEAGAKAPVWVVGKLASLAAAGDPRYDDAFARAARGDPLKNIVTARAKGKKKGNTVINTTQKNSSLATSFMSPSPTANARANNGAAKNTIEGIEKMGAAACETIRSMVAASKTLCKELAKTNNAAGLNLALNRVNALSPLPASGTKKRKPVKPRGPRKTAKASLSPIPEENAFSPPPGPVNLDSLSL
jgi:hypothetical protein